MRLEAWSTTIANGPLPSAFTVLTGASRSAFCRGVSAVSMPPPSRAGTCNRCPLRRQPSAGTPLQLWQLIRFLQGCQTRDCPETGHLWIILTIWSGTIRLLFALADVAFRIEHELLVDRADDGSVLVGIVDAVENNADELEPGP